MAIKKQVSPYELVTWNWNDECFGWIGLMNILADISYVVQFFRLFFVIGYFDFGSFAWFFTSL